MKKFTDHIYYMDNSPETDQPYVYLIHSSKMNLQIDAGNSPENYYNFLSEVKDLGLDEPKLLAITHWHWDHTFGMVACNVPMIASVKTNEYLKRVKNWKWTEEAMQERLKTGEDIQFCYDCMHKQYTDIGMIQVCEADITFDSEILINLGDVHVKGIHIDTPHTRDAVLYYVEEEKVVIAADAEYEDYYDNNSQYDPSRLASFIEFLEGLDFEYYLRGHDDFKLTKEEILNKLKAAM